MNQLSTEILTRRITKFSGKTYDITEKEYEDIREARANEQKGIHIERIGADINFAGIDDIDQIRDLEKEIEKVREINEAAERVSKLEVKTITKESSRSEAKRNGYNNIAWECPACMFWNPWLLQQDKESAVYRPVFDCGYCPGHITFDCSIT